MTAASGRVNGHANSKISTFRSFIFHPYTQRYYPTMPPERNPIWDHFLTGEKQNQSHARAHCRGCIEKHRPDGAIVELDDSGKPKLSSESWVIEACKSGIGGVLGVKDSMIAHILGKGHNSPCPNTSPE
ncbi:hypothetical protein Hypma_006484 [Hypsizygus marmoreus]|uniref:Uncharacterized protein n=1 Tax=Hypsizygus marmoreus TaxID=39966 RepID=A0A369K2I6_HYPMA|nr:hypothetical protein Hypma_006484 [Hypsizygus marmoreus]